MTNFIIIGFENIHTQKFLDDSLFNFFRNFTIFDKACLNKLSLENLIMQKKYQIILYGATGFTGRLCAEYFQSRLL